MKGIIKEMYFSKSLDKSVFITTNVCSENRSDCARMQEFIKINGWKVTSKIQEADIYYLMHVDLLLFGKMTR